MKKILLTLFLLTTLISLSHSQEPTRVKNYKGFVTAFRATDAAIFYKKNKTRIEGLTGEIKNSKLPVAKIEELEGKYKNIRSASLELYEGLISDLKTTERRRQMVTSPDPYLESLEGKIRNINSMCDDFESTYTATQSGTKANKVIVTVVTEIIIPLAMEFINEVAVPYAVQKYGDKHLRPHIVFKSW
ncbi:hypothetical protein [Desertivirga brevis]|uniref:hypothetical protein n=1 Tax=Desertivirga brevis TaxID=2810310 RepID=UPI001A97379E|nr:hypothetical protein [Pedobacter sp. SYSU D00873]